MLPDLIPSYSLGPIIGLAINATLCLCCLVLAIMYPQYKPLKSLCVFYAALVCFFLGFAAYGLQLSQTWILAWYRVMLVALAWLPFTWLRFARDLRGARNGFLHYLCLALGVVITAALCLSDHPNVLGPPLIYHSYAKVWRPQSLYLRPLVYGYALVVNLACIVLSYLRWWKKSPRPGFVTPLTGGLAVWLLAGVHDGVLSMDYAVPIRLNIIWLGGLLYSLGQVLALGLYFRQILKAQEVVRHELHETQERFQEVADMSPSAIVECDTHLRISYANRAALEMLGYDDHDLGRGLNLADLAPPEDPAPLRAFLARLQAGGVQGFEELTLARRDGSLVTVLVNFAPIVKAGQVVGGRAAALDISERTATAQALKASEERYRNILAQMEDGYYEIDLKGNFTFFNGSVCRMLEMSREQVLGLNYRQFMGPEQSARVYQEFNAVYQSGQPQMAFDWHLQAKGGQNHFFQSSIALMRDSQGQPSGFRGVVRDVTHSKLAEQDRQARLAAQMASQAKSQFLAKMSHEVRTPINAILGISELAADNVLDPTQAKYLATIQHETTALMALVNDILDFTKIEAGKIKLEAVEFDLRDLVEKLAASAAPLARRGGVDLYCRVDPSLPRLVVGDPNRLNQMLTNLVNNAIKFTSQGEISLEVEPLRGTGPGLALKFMVADSGIGIPADKQASIFESFTQADASTTRRYGGSGLGLSIVKELAALMGGAIGVESQEGQGSIFWFQVPLSPAGQEVSGPACSPRGQTVLLWHQNQQGGQAAAQYIQALGYGLSQAADLGQALALAEGCQVLVLGLSGTGEAAACQLARPRPAGPPLLVLTPSGQARSSPEVADLLPAALVSQPLCLGELARGLNLALGAPSLVQVCLAAGEPAGEQQSGLRILLAEDYPTNQLVLQRHLEAAGHQVAMTLNGRQAVEAFSQREFDLVFLDVQMPEMDGYAACRAMRAQEARRGAPGLPIIAMTAHATKEHREECFAAGMNDYLAKPFLRGDLLAMVSKWGGNPPAPTRPLQQGEPPKQAEPPDSPLDMELALAEFDLDLEFLRELLTGFMEQSAGRLLQMQAALAAGDASVLVAQAHAVKGGAANLTAQAVAEAAALLEGLARAGNLGQAGQALERLASELKRLEVYARQALGGTEP